MQAYYLGSILQWKSQPRTEVIRRLLYGDDWASRPTRHFFFHDRIGP